MTNLYALSFISAACMLAGLIFSRWRHPGQRDARETFLNLFIFLAGNEFQIHVINHLQEPVFNRVKDFALFDLSAAPFGFFLAYVAVDFVYYWRHRLEHTVPLLWAEHSVHHSSHEFNLSTAGRLPWIMLATMWVTYLPLIFVGFDPRDLVFAWSLNMTLQFLSHIDGCPEIPVLDRIFNTPFNHRVHHGRNPEYLHRNFAGTFMIWDHIFGTFTRQTAPVRLGCDYEINSQNPFTVNFQPMIRYLWRK